MNKQFHVHSVNQWVACRQESESMSSSLIDRVDRHHYRYAAHTAHAQRKPDGAHYRARPCVRSWAKDFLPPRARAPQTCCAATGVTPHSYQTRYASSAPAPLARPVPTHTPAAEHLIIIAQHSWNCRASRLDPSTSFINLISSITGCTEVKYLTRSIYSPSYGCSRMHDIMVMLIHSGGAII